jgi:hypothetical protein
MALATIDGRYVLDQRNNVLEWQFPSRITDDACAFR